MLLPLSLPSGGVWIEIPESFRYLSAHCGHFPQGKCGLKFSYRRISCRELLSLPSGEVWIEMLCNPFYIVAIPSLPSGEVWIEISSLLCSSSIMTGHFPQGKCGLKFLPQYSFMYTALSLPSGEVWIEIYAAWHVRG